MHCFASRGGRERRLGNRWGRGRREEVGGRRSRREKAVLPNYRDADSAVRSHLETCFSGGAEVIRPVDERLYGASWRETKLLW